LRSTLGFLFRRGALLALTLLGVAIAGVSVPTATQTAIANGDTRTIRLYHTHRKDSIEVTFKRNGYYDRAALRQLNYFLRDWRNDEQTNMDPRLFDVVWETYMEAGHRGAIHVVSAYRSPGTNAMLRRRSRGVAKNSQHTLGKAMDSFAPGVSMARVREIGMRLQAGGVGFYPRSASAFVHLDVGSVRAWPRMSRQQLARLFPNGETVHLPREGGTMPGYQTALAKIQRGGGSVGGGSGDDDYGDGRSFFEALAGSGNDDNMESPTAFLMNQRRRRAQPAPQPEIRVAAMTRAERRRMEAEARAAAKTEADAKAAEVRAAEAKAAEDKAAEERALAAAKAAEAEKTRLAEASAAAERERAAAAAARARPEPLVEPAVVAAPEVEVAIGAPQMLQPRLRGADNARVRLAGIPLPPRRPRTFAPAEVAPAEVAPATVALAGIPLPPRRPQAIAVAAAVGPAETLRPGGQPASSPTPPASAPTVAVAAAAPADDRPVVDVPLPPSPVRLATAPATGPSGTYASALVAEPPPLRDTLPQIIVSGDGRADGSAAPNVPLRAIAPPPAPRRVRQAETQQQQRVAAAAPARRIVPGAGAQPPAKVAAAAPARQASPAVIAGRFEKAPAQPAAGSFSGKIGAPLAATFIKRPEGF
jgi:uncharacterized protein YcbK (DUF882 family)